MKAKKVFEAPTYRVYELTEPIKKGKSDFPKREVLIDETMEDYLPRIKKEFKDSIGIEDR